MDWQLTCRVCLETGDMVSLFDWDENNEQLSDKYTYCCGVKVTKNDTLPTLICLNCVDRLTYAYQFKQQCLTSNETLKECLEEFERSSQAVGSSSQTTETETITIKQENGLLLQYELPVENEPPTSWSSALGKAAGAVLTKAPPPKKRGRRRKYPNEQGQIDTSPYQRKKPTEKDNDPESLTELLASGTLKEEIPTEGEDQAEDDHFGADFLDDDDPEYNPGVSGSEKDEKPILPSAITPRKRGRPRKNPPAEKKRKQVEEDGEDMLLKETIMAFSEPIPEHLLNPKPKKKYPPQQRKKYAYGKTHTCETCGSSFTSNASLQAHIRRHLGIKPFVCSVCGYSCVMKEALKRHMQRHTGERPYKCRICERRFGDFGTRQKHERLHMGLRPYQCSLCGKAFTYSYVLSNHMLTHTGEKKYSCIPCNKKFTKAHHLKYHNKVHHKDVYQQQLLEAEAKKMKQQMNRNSTFSGVLTGQIVGGTLHIVQATNEDGEGMEDVMQVVEEQEQESDMEGDTSDRETSRAVADMQSVVLESEFSMEEEEIKGV